LATHALVDFDGIQDADESRASKALLTLWSADASGTQLLNWKARPPTKMASTYSTNYQSAIASIDETIYRRTES
jgi:hypothetical protein